MLPIILLGKHKGPSFCWVSIKGPGPYPTKMEHLLWLCATELWVGRVEHICYTWPQNIDATIYKDGSAYSR